MIDTPFETTTDTATIVVPYRYHASAGAFIEAVHRAQSTLSARDRRQSVSVARIWYDTLSDNLRAIKTEIAETRGWISDHAEHPLMPQMRAHLAQLSNDASSLDHALTDLLVALSTAGDLLVD
jgi:hypothetical protein